MTYILIVFSSLKSCNRQTRIRDARESSVIKIAESGTDIRVTQSTRVTQQRYTLQAAARQIIILPTEAGGGRDRESQHTHTRLRALVRADIKSYYEIIINGIMVEVTRYVFE